MSETRSYHSTFVSPQEVWEVLRRHKKKALLLLFASTLTTVAVVVLLPNPFVSEAKFFVRVGREAVALDPTATMGDTIYINKPYSNEVNSIVDVVHSRHIAERVVDLMGVNLILNGPASESSRVAESQEGAAPENSLSLRSGRDSKGWDTIRERVLAPVSQALLPQLSDHEQAVARVRNSTEASSRQGSNIIVVSCSAEWPEVAQRMAETITAELPMEYLRLNRTEGSLEFFTNQTQELQERLAEAEKELRNHKSQFGWISVEGREDSLEGLISDVELELLHTERSLQAGQAMVKGIQQQLTGLSPTVVTGTFSGMPNPARDGMRQQLYDLQIREEELLAKYSEEHFLVKAIREQRTAVAAILDAEEVSRTQTTTGPNPSYQALESQLQTELASQAALKSQRDVLLAQRDQVRSQVAILNDETLKMKRLQRCADALAASYQLSLEKLEQARIEQDLRASQISSINVLQPPTYASQTAFGRKTLASIGGMLFSLFATVSLVLAAEAMDRTLKSPLQAERELGLPVLACVPRLSSHNTLLLEKQYRQASLCKPNNIKPSVDATCAAVSESA